MSIHNYILHLFQIHCLFAYDMILPICTILCIGFAIGATVQMHHNQLRRTEKNR